MFHGGAVFLNLILAGQLLQGFSFGLRHQQREQSTEEIDATERNKRVLDAETRWVTRVRLGRVGILRGVQKPECPDDGSGLPGGGGNPVASRPEPGREDLGGNNESGGIGPKIGEEKRQ